MYRNETIYIMPTRRILCIVISAYRARKMPTLRILCSLISAYRARKFATRSILCIVIYAYRARKFATRRILCSMIYACRARIFSFPSVCMCVCVLETKYKIISMICHHIYNRYHLFNFKFKFEF